MISQKLNNVHGISKKHSFFPQCQQKTEIHSYL